MTDREKVIAAYICHNEKLPDKRCEKCPHGYEYLDQTGDNYFVYCNTARIMVDAIDLLKAQEPRVMTYEELSTIDGAFIIESSAVHPLEWVFFFDTDAKSDAVWVQGFDGERYIVYREDYGIYVRCWTSRPDQATREAVKWDAQEQRDYEAAVEMAEYCERYEPTYNADDGSM